MAEQFNESAFHESDIMFWSNQISKQVYYLTLSIDGNCNYLYQAKLLYGKWQKFILTLPYSTSTEGLVIQQNVSTFYDFERFSRSKRDYLATDRNLNVFNALINATKHFVEGILITVTASVTNYDNCPRAWIGFNYPTQLEALLMSVNYAKRKVNCDNLCDKTTVKFWNVLIRDNLLITLHLLDPSEYELLVDGYKLAFKYKCLEKLEDCKKYELKSVKYNKEVDKYFRTLKCLLVKNDVRSIIFPLLLTLFIRYIQRALRDQTWIYCKTRHKCCPGLDECCTKFKDLVTFIGKEGNKCCKEPKPLEVKC